MSDIFLPFGGGSGSIKTPDGKEYEPVVYKKESAFIPTYVCELSPPTAKDPSPIMNIRHIVGDIAVIISNSSTTPYKHIVYYDLKSGKVLSSIAESFSSVQSFHICFSNDNKHLYVYEGTSVRKYNFLGVNPIATSSSGWSFSLMAEINGNLFGFVSTSLYKINKDTLSVIGSGVVVGSPYTVAGGIKYSKTTGLMYIGTSAGIKAVNPETMTVVATSSPVEQSSELQIDESRNAIYCVGLGTKIVRYNLSTLVREATVTPGWNISFNSGRYTALANNLYYYTPQNAKYMIGVNLETLLEEDRLYNPLDYNLLNVCLHENKFYYRANTAPFLVLSVGFEDIYDVKYKLLHGV